jgi:ABC-type transport system substrate-binding protein
MPAGHVRRSRAGLVLAGVAAALVLVGCTSAPEAPAPAASSSPSAPASAAPTAAPAPTLDPAGDATANLAFFDATNRALLAGTPTPSGREIIDTLVAAGFVKADMEVSPDVTVGNEAAGSIQFSVRLGATCLVGQTGEAGYNALAAPVLGTGKCLVGTTRAIDW